MLSVCIAKFILFWEKNMYNSHANALWHILPFQVRHHLYFVLQEYLDSTLKLYHADLQAVDFISASDESRQLINIWVEEQTESEKIII